MRENVRGLVSVLLLEVLLLRVRSAKYRGGWVETFHWKGVLTCEFPVAELTDLNEVSHYMMSNKLHVN